MSLPDRVTYDPLDDTSSVEIDLDELYKKFIIPIERVRSFAAPTISTRPVGRDGNNVISIVSDTASIDTSEPQESRAHAFYRMIGFPVVSENLDFYNPGFDPTIKADERVKNINIASNIPQPIRALHQKREMTARARYAVFKRASVDASVFAVAIGVPNGIKPFLQMNPNDNFNSMITEDKQEFSIPIRKLYLTSKYERVDGNNFTNFFSSGSHILRPFHVDPNIADTVTGFANETRHVAAPFLPTKNSTGIERNIFAKRPGLEFILRMRLRQHSDIDGLRESFFILGGNDTANVDLRLAVSTILNNENITNEDIIERLKNLGNLEELNIINLTRNIKGIIELLIKSVNELDFITKQIRWSPLPSERGPEGGSEIASIIRPKNRTELEKNILELTILSQNAQRQALASDNPEIINSDFYLSEFENNEIKFINHLNRLIEERDNYQRLGSNALKIIELITGEVSGLGLIDILAIYTALWAIDIEVLLSMLDDRSFNRLYEFNPDLRTTEVENRRTSGSPSMGIDEAMQAFERQVINILSYCDKIFRQKLGSAVNSDGGAVPM